MVGIKPMSTDLAKRVKEEEMEAVLEGPIEPKQSDINYTREALYSEHFVESPKNMPDEFGQFLWIIDKMLALGQLTEQHHRLLILKVNDLMMNVTVFGKEYQSRRSIRGEILSSLNENREREKDHTWEFTPKFLLNMRQAEFTIWFQSLRSIGGKEREMQTFSGRRISIDEKPQSKGRRLFGLLGG